MIKRYRLPLGQPSTDNILVSPVLSEGLSAPIRARAASVSAAPATSGGSAWPAQALAGVPQAHDNLSLDGVAVSPIKDAARVQVDDAARSGRGSDEEVRGGAALK